MAGSTSANTDLSSRAFTRILLVKPSSLGDVVHALPVLHGLRVRYPQARIDWLVASAFAPLLEGHDELDGLILFDRRRFGRIGRSPRVAAEFLRFIRGLRERRYDLAIDLQGLFRTGLMTWASGAGVRIGFQGAREGAWAFYTHHLPVGGDNVHAVERNYQVAGLLGFDEVPVCFNLALTESLRNDAAGLLAEAGLGAGQRVVAVVPGARWETKVWLPERFAETICELHGAGNVRCLLLGGPDDAGRCELIARMCRQAGDGRHAAPVNLAGKTTVRQLAALIGIADVVLCQDSAAMHLAVALERPLVCLIGPTNPARTGPYQRGGDVVRVPLDCAPCYLRRLSQCRNEHRCMRNLDSARVVAAVRRELEGYAGAGAGIA